MDPLNKQGNGIGLTMSGQPTRHDSRAECEAGPHAKRPRKQNSHLKIAVYPGTFDPFHNGHLEIIRRALGTFDHIIVAVGANPEKEVLFSLEERLDMIANSIRGDSRIEYEAFDGLTVKYAEKKRASAIIRGLRAVSDFEYEFQLALMNRKLSRKIETFFLMTAGRYLYVSSRIIKVALYGGGSPEGLVPEYVLGVLKKKFPHLRNQNSRGKTCGRCYPNEPGS